MLIDEFRTYVSKMNLDPGSWSANTGCTGERKGWPEIAMLGGFTTVSQAGVDRDSTTRQSALVITVLETHWSRTLLNSRPSHVPVDLMVSRGTSWSAEELVIL